MVDSPVRQGPRRHSEIPPRPGSQSRFPVFAHPRPIAVAHRGGAGEAPENTMAAFANAVRLGFRFIETDVQATRDGVLLAFHDDQLARLTGRPGRISEVTWAELRSVRVLGREPIPRLEEMLEAWPGMCFVLELKSDLAVEPLAAAIRRAGALERVCVGAFADRRVARLRRLLGPRLCTALGRGGVARLRLASLGLPAGSFQAGAALVPRRYRGLTVVDRRLIAAARRHRLPVQVWTVNEEAEMAQLIDLGVDGIITDRPSLLKAVLQRRSLWVS